MSKKFLAVMRDEPLDISVDLRRLIPADHLVWFVMKLMDQVLDTRGLLGWAKLGGRGRAPYNPVMLATVLIYGMIDDGEESGSRLAELCRYHLVYRVICGGNQPDHATLDAFKQRFLPQVADLKEQVLQLCALAGLGDFSLLAGDGCKMGAAASKKANRTEAKLAKLIASVECELQEVAEENAARTPTPLGGASVPVPAGRKANLLMRLRKAHGQVKARREQRQATKSAYAAAREKNASEYLANLKAGTAGKRTPILAGVEAATWRYEKLYAQRLRSYEASMRARAQAAAEGRGTPGPVPQHPDQQKHVKDARARIDKARTARAAYLAKLGEPADSTTIVGNTTDPDSRLMHTHNRTCQCYNCQAVGTIDGLLIASHVTQDPTDFAQAKPLLEAVTGSLRLFEQTRLAAGWTCTCPLRARPHHHGPLPHHYRADHLRTDVGAAEADTGTQATETNDTAFTQAVAACPVHHGLDVGWLLLDAGYLTSANVTADGPPRLIAMGKLHRQVKDSADHPTTAPPNPTAPPTEQMRHLLRNPDNATAYTNRGWIIEGQFGQIRHNRSMRTLTTRGLDNVTAEWDLICTTRNIRHLARKAQHGDIDLDELKQTFKTARAATANPAA